MITESTENLLAEIYRLTRRAPHAHTKEIAARLGVSMPTVSAKIIRLAEEGYVNHAWRRGVTLTEEGRRLALRVLRRHRLLETFLVEMLHLSIDEVDEEAHRLEHVVSDRLLDALDAALGYPETDPHGHPIPTGEGRVTDPEYGYLSGASAGERVLVRQVSDRDREHLCYLKKLGVVPGAVLSVLGRAPFSGPLTLGVDGRTVVLAHVMAKTIAVTVVGEVCPEEEHCPEKEERRTEVVENGCDMGGVEGPDECSARGKVLF